MSPRDWFWFLAGALVAITVTASLRGWLRVRPDLAGRPALLSFAVPIAAALALIGVALGIYFLLGSSDTPAEVGGASAARALDSRLANEQPAQSNGGSLDEVTKRLAARLAANGGPDSDWKLLEQSYEYMGRTAEAQAARAHIAFATPADAAGISSQVTTEQLATVADAFENPVGAAQKAAGARVASSRTAEISGTVELASKLAPRAAAGAILFIYASQPNVSGPPLAVLRVRAEHWPVTFTLNDANSMVPGRTLSTADHVQLEARISKSGDARPQTGDLVGTVTSVNPREGRAIKISINREIS